MYFMLSYIDNTKWHVFNGKCYSVKCWFIILGCPAAADGQTFECCMPLTFRSGRRNVNVKFTVTKCDEIQYSVERKQWTKAGLASGCDFHKNILTCISLLNCIN